MTGLLHPRIVAATVRRVLGQLRRDPRTMALLLLVPCLLELLLRYVFDRQPAVFDAIGAPLLALFPFTTMFVVTSVAMLRERTTGTLERLLTTPMAKLDLLLGYGIAFALVALVQVTIAATVTLAGLGLNVRGGAGLVVLLAVLDALLGMSLGLFLSAFARTEFQAVQFLPAFVLPQLLLCGLFIARDQMVAPLRLISNLLPLSFAIDGMTRVATSTEITSGLALDLAVIGGCIVLALVLGAATLRRRSA